MISGTLSTFKIREQELSSTIPALRKAFTGTLRKRQDKMSLTLPELKQRLAQLELDGLCELLQITPELLVELAEDYIAENYDLLVQEVGNDDFSTYEQEG